MHMTSSASKEVSIGEFSYSMCSLYNCWVGLQIVKSDVFHIYCSNFVSIMHSAQRQRSQEDCHDVIRKPAFTKYRVLSKYRSGNFSWVYLFFGQPESIWKHQLSFAKVLTNDALDADASALQLLGHGYILSHACPATFLPPELLISPFSGNSAVSSKKSFTKFPTRTMQNIS